MKKQILNIGKVLNKAEQRLINGGGCGENTICVPNYEDLSPNCIPFSIVQTSCGWSCMIPPCE